MNALDQLWAQGRGMDPLVLVGSAALLLVLVAIVVVVIRRWAAARAAAPLPLIYFPAPSYTPSGNTTAHAPAPASAAPSPPPQLPPQQQREFDAEGRLDPADWSGAVAALGPDATLQLLPGRLEPVNGGGGEEIRFVRVQGVNRFTFGRSSGPRYTHIQLRAPTASRMHGYMAFEDGHWRIGNMSETNHVVVNGTELPSLESHRLLKDGDRIEFGEVAFVFRER